MFQFLIFTKKNLTVVVVVVGKSVGQQGGAVAEDETAVALVPSGSVRAASRGQGALRRTARTVHLLRRPQIGHHSNGRRETLGRR